MLRLLYFSNAHADLTREEVDEIVAQAAEKNAAHQITGVMAYNGRNFCQVLEGEDAAVLELLRLIENDPRHSGFKELDRKDITKRHFADWSMRLVDDLDFSVVINAMQA